MIKHVQLPEQRQHPRGWNSEFAHQRKLDSYKIETYWYQHYAKQCNQHCRVAKSYLLEAGEQTFFMAFEDLDASGFNQRKQHATLEEMQNCLSWLAHFHAIFIGQQPKGLWQQGTYWHLQTRPDEFKALPDSPLKQAAPLIDKTLANCRYTTLIHGDAKLANFCFAPELNAIDNEISNNRMSTHEVSRVAAVDFQYVGGGCGMKDVALFISSCLNAEACAQHETVLLNHYFATLRSAIISYGKNIPLDELEQEWRDMYAFAWADFYRFLKGWCPDHWKVHAYSEQLTLQTLATFIAPR